MNTKKTLFSNMKLKGPTTNKPEDSKKL